MEIVKQNETFTLKDTTDAYEMTGTANRDVSGSMNVSINVNRIGGERVGDCYYNKYAEMGNVNFNVSSSEDNREELIAYADTVIDSVLEYFKVTL